MDLWCFQHGMAKGKGEIGQGGSAGRLDWQCWCNLGFLVQIRVSGPGAFKLDHLQPIKPLLETPDHRVVRQILDKSWTRNPIFVQHLSKPCPMSVHVQDLSA